MASISGLLVDITSDFHYVFYNSSFFLISAALFMGLSFCALEKKNKSKEASKVPLDNHSRYQYNEMPTEPLSETQSPPVVVYITSIWKEGKKKKRNTSMWPVQSYTRGSTDGRWENKHLLSTTVIILLPCTSTLRGCVRLHVSVPDHRLSPEPSASQRAKGQRELCFPKANHGITAMVTSAERQKLCLFNWFKSVPLRSHWNFTYTFQLVALDNTY